MGLSLEGWIRYQIKKSNQGTKAIALFAGWFSFNKILRAEAMEGDLLVKLESVSNSNLESTVTAFL